MPDFHHFILRRFICLLTLVACVSVPQLWAAAKIAHTLSEQQAKQLEVKVEKGQRAASKLLRLPAAANNKQLIAMAREFLLNRDLIHYNHLAVHWWTKAEKHGYVPAVDRLAMAYYSGQGVTKNYLNAWKLWHFAAKHGDAEGERNLAVCYGNGIGTAANLAKAASWIKKAAAQGDQVSLYYLGNWYDIGHGVKKNQQKALACWKKAAAMGGQIEAEANAQIAKASPAKK